ncbi:NADH-quinone oxidoreductase subunit J family protein [Shewanella surugensis]|uniref:NADH-quinone oxidoreductase subunit J n=1 Tax=Shewanella surugensis TaxID=212020 RepID=A0ABT0L8R1_9GAMM|nr:NADH-quinone oxidoreductase subunit J [Shewanella surugensis]MCL1124088.1 NADH-quinone oxidoreductase subunit J [Shewanella surugensis]
MEIIIWNIIFYLSSGIVLGASIALIFVKQAMHGAVYLIISLLALAIDFYLLGSPLLAVLQVILYIGAIMILYVFFIMINPQNPNSQIQRPDLTLPLILLLALVIETTYLLLASQLNTQAIPITVLDPKALGIALFGHYKIAVEVVSSLLLVALIAVMYLAKPFMPPKSKPTLGKNK